SHTKTKFLPLNDSSDESEEIEKDTYETQIEQCLELYQKALRFQQKKRTEEAEALYHKLTEYDVIKTPNQTSINPEKHPNEVKTNTRRQAYTQSILQFAIYKNYASLLMKNQEPIGQLDRDQKILEYYFKALEIDPSDSEIWLHVGQIALKKQNSRLARHAFEKGVSGGSNMSSEDTFESLRPTQWRCLDGLCEILYNIGDFITCLKYLEKILKVYPDHERALGLRKVILEQNFGHRSLLHRPYMFEDTSIAGLEFDNPQDMQWAAVEPTKRSPFISDLYNEASPEPAKFILKQKSWEALGSLLLEIHEHVQKGYDPISLPNSGNSIDVEYKIIHRRIKIILEDENLDQETATTAASDIVKKEEPETETMPPNNAKDSVNSEETVAPTTLESTPVPSDKKEKSTEKTKESNSKRKREKEDWDDFAERKSTRLRQKSVTVQPETKRKQQEGIIMEQIEKLLSLIDWRFSEYTKDAKKVSAYLGLPDEKVSNFVKEFPKEIFNMKDDQASVSVTNEPSKPEPIVIDLEEEVTEIEADPFFCDMDLLTSFIEEENEANSGILDFCCHFVCKLILGADRDHLDRYAWKHRWSSGMSEVLFLMIQQLDSNFLEIGRFIYFVM
ncbi:Histone transcription regulator 3, partial [Basidiobolus ranarum]